MRSGLRNYGYTHHKNASFSAFGSMLEMKYGMKLEVLLILLETADMFTICDKLSTLYYFRNK